MNIAIVGTRGIPARYGGFETLADQLSKRLVERGHTVTVYCRKYLYWWERPSASPDDVFDHRIRRVILPSLPSKHFDTLFHTFLSTVHVLFGDAEVVLICNVANSLFAWMPRVAGKPTALNVDGLDRKRRKWNFLGQSFLHLCELLSTYTPTRVVTDARAIQDYYWQRYGKKSEMIGYGAEPPSTSNHFANFGLSSRRYILYIARLEPENNPELVLRAYGNLETDWPLVIVGGNPYQPVYVRQLESLAARRVIFTGPVYGDAYWSLQKNAGAFVFAGEIGGIHPALVEAMAAGNAILYLDTAANRETARDCGIPFHPEESDLAKKLEQLIADPTRIEELAKQAQTVARTVYGWDKVVDQYEALFLRMLCGGQKTRPEEQATEATNNE
jgi:glycosyltransferase involved in cell wall biosynthesis